MRKIITLIVMLLFLGMTISSSTGLHLEKQSIKPISFGNILYVGGNGTGNYSTIQDAIDNASDGDTVYVYDDNSPYYENVVVNKSINLIGEDKNTTVIDGNNIGDDVVRIYRTNNVTVDGFTIQNSGIVNNYDSGIEVYDSNYNVITNNKIVSNLRGAYFYGSDFNIFSDNIVESNNIAGVFLRSYSDYNSISNNTIISNLYGLELSYSSNNEIFQNKIKSNTRGIYFDISWDNEISKNDFIMNVENIYWYNCWGIYFRNNYWDRPRIIPKLIWGTAVYAWLIFLIDIPWFFIDWRPALRPNDIGV